MRRLLATSLAVASLALPALAACGGSDGAEPEAPDGGVAAVDTSSPVPGWLSASLGGEGGQALALLLGTADHAVGENRVSFVVLRKDLSLVQAPRARVLVGPEDAAAGTAAEAGLVPLGPHDHPDGTEPHDHVDVTDLYVATLDFPRPGVYWLLVEPEGTSVRAIGKLEVRERSVTPAVGALAIPSDNPTLDDAFAEDITTASPPDLELLRHSVADSMAEGVPFVVAFATPRFCQTRTCGPTVEVVDAVRREFEPSGIRFIHIEIFEDNDPNKGPNRWVAEWGLPTEPWVFVVDGDGIIREKFEGGVSVSELRAAVRRHLL